MTSEISGQKIAVLMGGPGLEREVSLATGRGVSKALRSLGAEAVELLIRRIGGSTEKSVMRKLQPELRIRESCGFALHTARGSVSTAAN